MSIDYEGRKCEQSLQLWLQDFLSPKNEENLVLELPFLVSSILNTNCLIASENGPYLSKYCIRLSTMIQSKSSTVKWSACVLIRSTVHANIECIGSHGAKWVQLLLKLVGQKNETSILRSAGIRALCEIFSQVKGKPALIREIATPNLPVYAAILIDLCKDHDSNLDELLACAIVCLTRVLIDNPTTLRPWISKLRSAVLPISINPKAGNLLNKAACEALAVTYSISHSQNAGTEWLSSVRNIIERIKTVSLYSLRHFEGAVIDYDNQSSDEIDIIGSCREAIASFKLLRLLLQQSTSTEVEVPVGSLIGLVESLLNFNPYSKFKPTADKSDKQVTLTTVIPQLHEQCYEVLTLLMTTFTWTIVPFLSDMFFYLDIEVQELTLDVDRRVYAALLNFVSSLLLTVKVLPKQFTDTVNKLVACVIDFILRNQVILSSSLADYMSSPESFQRANPSIDLIDKSFEFLTAVIQSCPDLSLSSRSRIDRLIILHPRAAMTRDILSSTLLCTTRMTKRSILPIAARIDPCNSVVTTLIHPRLPPLNVHTSQVDTSIESEDVLSEVRADSGGSKLDSMELSDQIPPAEIPELLTDKIVQSEEIVTNTDGNGDFTTSNVTKRKLEMAGGKSIPNIIEDSRKKKSIVENSSLATEVSSMSADIVIQDASQGQKSLSLKDNVNEVPRITEPMKEASDSDIEIPDIDVNEDTSDDE